MPHIPTRPFFGRTLLTAVVVLGAWLTTRSAHAEGMAPLAATARCEPPLAINTPRTHFRHLSTRLEMDHQQPEHRGHDSFVRDGEPAWASATFAYGVPGHPLQDEDVDVWLLADCAHWTYLGSARTSGHGSATRRPDGSMSNTPGEVAFRIPDSSRLAPGLHKVRFVVRADRSIADDYIDVIGPETHVVVSDVDGTLTESEGANFWYEFGLHRVPNANPGAAEALRTLAARGYQVFYLTGRPEWTTQQTHAWLTSRGFPNGVLRTRPGLGIGGPDVTAYKIDALAGLRRVLGRSPDYGFGNTLTDVTAYRTAQIEPTHRFFYRYAGACDGGQRHDDYRALVPRLASAALVGQDRSSDLRSAVR